MQILSAGRFKHMLRASKAAPQQRAALSEALLHKEFLGRADRLGDRQFRFTISTSSVDRQDDTVAVGGWDLTAYLRNPVVLWAHGFDATVGTWPIGKAFDIGPENGALKATVELDPFDMPMTGPAAEACARKLADGSLSATSVGFRPLDYDETDDPSRGGDGWFPGIDFKRQELLEFSIVAVPANSEALVDLAEDQDDVPRGSPPPVLDPALAARVQAAKAAKAARRRTERFLALG